MCTGRLAQQNRATRPSVSRHSAFRHAAFRESSRPSLSKMRLLTALTEAERSASACADVSARVALLRRTAKREGPLVATSPSRSCCASPERERHGAAAAGAAATPMLLHAAPTLRAPQHAPAAAARARRAGCAPVRRHRPRGAACVVRADADAAAAAAGSKRRAVLRATGTATHTLSADGAWAQACAGCRATELPSCRAAAWALTRGTVAICARCSAAPGCFSGELRRPQQLPEPGLVPVRAPRAHPAPPHGSASLAAAFGHCACTV